MKNYWVSWYAYPGIGSWELHSPWWISGYRGDDDAPSICAAIKAESEEDAWSKIIAAHDMPPKYMEKRFCEEREADWSPFSDRFPKADWMQWSTP